MASDGLLKLQRQMAATKLSAHERARGRGLGGMPGRCPVQTS